MSKLAVLRLTNPDVDRALTIKWQCEGAIKALRRANKGLQDQADSRGAARVVVRKAKGELNRGAKGDKLLADFHKVIVELVELIEKHLMERP